MFLLLNRMGIQLEVNFGYEENEIKIKIIIYFYYLNFRI